jgi:hypothetical protein
MLPRRKRPAHVVNAQFYRLSSNGRVSPGHFDFERLMTANKLTPDETGKAWAAAFILLCIIGVVWFVLAKVIPPVASDPITATIYGAEAYEWVEIGPEILPRGASFASTKGVLSQAGFEFWAEYEAGSPVDDGKLSEGITHAYSREGRSSLFCRERLFVDLGIADDKLVKAWGQSHWTCL